MEGWFRFSSRIMVLSYFEKEFPIRVTFEREGPQLLQSTALYLDSTQPPPLQVETTVWHEKEGRLAYSSLPHLVHSQNCVMEEGGNLRIRLSNQEKHTSTESITGSNTSIGLEILSCE